MDEFPAAHSMDTTWFAVDEDGRVARFDSGEAGAVPVGAANGGGAADPSFDVLLLDVASVIDRLASEPAREHAADELPRRAILVVEPVAQSIESLDAIVVRASNPRVLVTKKALDPKERERLAKHPDVKLLLTHDEIDEWLEEGSNVIQFSRDEQRYDEPGAYRRASMPASAMRVEDVPEMIRADVAALRLPLKFSDVDQLHLADHMKDADAATWGDTTLRGEEIPVDPAVIAKAAKAESDKKRRMLLAVVVIAAFVLFALIFRRR